MKLIKKVASTAALVVLASSMVAAGSANAYSPEELAAANNLASHQIINDHSSNPAGYALDQFVLRQEIAAVARGIAGIPKKATCDNEFTDVSATNPNTWACYTVEALRDAGKIAANPLFRPEDNITKAEALGMVVKAACGDQYAYDASKGTTWQEQVRDFAVSKGIVSTFSDFNALATRGFSFEAGNNAMSACSTTTSIITDNGNDDDFNKLLCQLDPSSCQDNTKTGGEEQTQTGGEEQTQTGGEEQTQTGGEEQNVTTSNSVELASDTPAGATVPKGISGLPVAKFVITAGGEDLTVNTLVVRRAGLSDKDTLTGLAAFTNEGRISKSKDDSQENDTEANLTLDNGGLVIKAGESKEVTIVADINSSANTYDEFAIELKEVKASSEVSGTPVLANTMKVGAVQADTLTLETNGTPSNPKAGQSDVDVAKFKLKGDNDSDIVVKSITLKGVGSIDEEDELVNYKLKNNGNILAETAKANGKYVTFDLGDGFTVKEDKTEKFVVTADVIGGASKTIEFKVDKNLDITAVGTKYGYGAAVDLNGVTSFGSITVEPGELTLKEIDAPKDKIREDKDNVELGSIKVTNVAGSNLELQKLSVKVTSTGTGVENVFENFEAEINGSSYELTRNGTGNNVYFADEDLNITLPAGITTITFRADTKKDLSAAAGDKFTLSIATPTNTPADGEFYVVETEDDNVITDMTPSSITFKNLELISAGATLANVPTASKSVVRGAEGVVAGMFEVEADEASDITMDEMKVKFTASGADADNSVISEVALYKGSVSDANLLDKVSGSNLASGVATFDGFNVTIPADQKENFVVTVSVVDGSDAVGKVINTELQSVSLEDDDSDDVTATPATVTGNASITVTNAGTLTITGDKTNTDNKDAKTILAGNSKVVFSTDVLADNEEVKVEKVTFNYTGDDLNAAGATATLYLDNVEVKTNSNSDITSNTITFDNMNNLVIPTQTAELRVEINSQPVGQDNAGKAVPSAEITGVTVASGDATGVDSGKDLASGDISVNVSSADAEPFSIVPVALTPSVVSTFGSSAKLKVTVDAGNNHQDTSNAAPTAKVKKLVFSTDSNLDASNYTLKDEDSNVLATGTANGGNVEFDLGAGFDVSDSETFEIVTTTPADQNNYTWGLQLLKDGIEYDVNGVSGATNLKVSLTNNLDLGSSSN